MAKPKPPVYAIQIAADKPELGVSLVSFVGTPAIGVNFVTLSAEPEVLPVRLSVDTKKQLLTGPVLIPNKQILRVNPEDESLYYITFSSEVIEQLRDRFHEQNNTQATNLEHATPLEGNYVVESWIITDAEQDKAVALGFTDLPVGTWMASYKVSDAKLWADEVETGNVKGFSMEGLLGHTTLSQQVVMQKNPKPGNKFSTFFSELKKLVLSAEAEAAGETAEQLATLTLDDDTSVEVDATTQEVFTLDAEGKRGDKLADGTYKLKDGSELIVKDGKKAEAAATTADATTTDASAEGTATKLAEEVSTSTDIVLEGGAVVKYDIIGKKLYDAAGQLLKSGTYKTENGVYFKVTTDQWWYETQETLMAQVKELETKLSGKDATVQELNTKLADVTTKLSAKPAAAPIKVALGDKGGKTELSEEKLTPGQARFQRAQALSGLK
jgi:hypothetical protein